MLTYLDDNRIDTHTPTLAAALDAALDAAGERLIIEATADGSPVPNDHLADPPQNSPYCAELRFTTADPASLVRVTLHDAADSLDAMQDAHAETARLFQTGQNDEALAKLATLLDVWQTAEETVTACRAVEGVTLGDHTTDERLTSAINALAVSLADVKNAIASRDLTTVADIAAFDLTEHAESWAELLRHLADHTNAS